MKPPKSIKKQQDIRSQPSLKSILHLLNQRNSGPMTTGVLLVPSVPVTKLCKGEHLKRLVFSRKSILFKSH